jgi:hypothetical protein
MGMGGQGQAPPVYPGKDTRYPFDWRLGGPHDWSARVRKVSHPPQYMYVCVCICTYLCMYVCMYDCMYDCMYVWLYLCMCVWLYVCMLVYMYTYVCMYICTLCMFCTAVCLRFNFWQFLPLWQIFYHKQLPETVEEAITSCILSERCGINIKVLWIDAV